MKAKTATYHGNDQDGDVFREWYKIGRKIYGITSDGELLALDGTVMMTRTPLGYVIATGYDQRAVGIAEAIRKARAAVANIASLMALGGVPPTASIH